MNGYHRLSACIEAGVPFRTLLVPHETWTTVDTGKYSATLKGIITPSMLGGIIAYLYIQKGYKFSKLEEFVDRLATSGLSIYATGRVKLKSCRGFDKQKAICDIWNKFKTCAHLV